MVGQPPLALGSCGWVFGGIPGPSRLRGHTLSHDAVDLSKMVQVVCRLQADELLNRLPSAYLVNPVELHPPCARDRLQQSQVALAQHPKDPCRKPRILLRVTQAIPPMPPHPTTLRPRPDSPACFAIAIPSPAPRPPSALRSRRLTTFQAQDAGSTARARHRADADRVAKGWLVVQRWAPHRQDSLGLEFGMLRTSLPLVLPVGCACGRTPPRLGRKEPSPPRRNDYRM